MPPAKIYNKECGRCREVDSNTIDVVVSSPPYNIGHAYPDYTDNLPIQKYFNIWTNLIRGIRRVIKPNGIVAIDIAATIIWENMIWLPISYLEKKFLDEGFSLDRTIFYRAISDEIQQMLNKHMCLPSNQYAHSEVQAICIFSCNSSYNLYPYKIKESYSYGKFNTDEAWWSRELVEDLVEGLDLAEKNVLDPFMGSGQLGRRVLAWGGNFIGYEISKAVFNYASKIIGTKE